MPVFLSHDLIDKTAWDKCVLSSANALLYAMSWYLDVVAPGWCAVVEKTPDNSYSAVMPLPVKWRCGVGFVYQPPFTQQLGVFTGGEANKLLWPFLAAIPASIKYLSVSLHTGHSAPEGLPFGATAGKRITHQLQLGKPYSELLKNYKGNQRRALQKPLPADFILTESNSVSGTIALFRRTRGAQVKELKNKHYQMLHRLVYVLQQHKCIRILEVRESNELVSGAVFAAFAGRIIYLFSANSAKSRQTSANARILDFVIKQNAGKNLLLDFEGGNIPGIGHFFRGFGALPAEFVSLTMNRLPWPVSKFFN